MNAALSDLDSAKRKKRRLMKHPADSSQLPSPPELKKGLSLEDLQQQQVEEKQKRQQQSQSHSKPTVSTEKANPSMPASLNIEHDTNCCMFKISLDCKGNTAALCYLPTRYRNIIEFYHIEIPVLYRQQGLGDLLLFYAFQWVKKLNLQVIPTCPFVVKYLETHFPDHESGDWTSIVNSATTAAATAPTATAANKAMSVDTSAIASKSSISIHTPITPPNTSPIASTPAKNSTTSTS